MDSPNVYSPKFGDEVVGSYAFTHSVAEPVVIQVYTPRYSEYTLRSKSGSLVVPSHEFFLDEPRESDDSENFDHRLSYEEVTVAAHLFGLWFGSKTVIEDEEDIHSDCSSVSSHDREFRSRRSSSISVVDFPAPDLMKLTDDVPKIGKAAVGERKFAGRGRMSVNFANNNRISMDFGRTSISASNTRMSIDISRLSIASMDASRMSAPNLDFAQILNDRIAPRAKKIMLAIKEKVNEIVPEEEIDSESESKCSDYDCEAADDQFEVASDISETDSEITSGTPEQDKSTIQSAHSSPIVKMSSLYSELKARGTGHFTYPLSMASSFASRKTRPMFTRAATSNSLAHSRTLGLQKVLTATARSGLSYCVRSRSESSLF